LLLLSSVAAPESALAQSVPAQGPAPSSFTVFVRGVPIGTEQSSVEKTSDGWVVIGSSRIAPPFDVVVRNLEIRYDSDWRPQEFSVEATVRGDAFKMQTAFAAGMANSEMLMGGETSSRSDSVAAGALILPNLLFSSHEALAAHVVMADSGTEMQGWVPPETPVTLRFGPATKERIRTPSRIIEAVRRPVTFIAPGDQVETEIWADERGRLLRLRIPAEWLEVVRNDIGAVSARVERFERPGDQHVSIPGNGFSLAGTLSSPPSPPAGRLPAVVIVGRAEAPDRDEPVPGAPTYGQLASELADAGFIVLRYDRRGVGQSGGRLENATLADAAEDVRAVVRFLSRRRDVDGNRIAVVGHAEGGWAALQAASNDRRIAAVALVSTPGTTGAELILEQQRRILDEMDISEAEEEERVRLQQRIHDAVTKGTGWEGIPPELRRHAETPWFESFLRFDPAGPMRRSRQPVLILHGGRDREVEPSNAELLEQLARSRRNKQAAEAVEKVVVPGVNHLLLEAQEGRPVTGAAKISPGVVLPLAAWLQQTLAPRR
jgi:pimeloyl-ACP methyl ester carboxylesterase